MLERDGHRCCRCGATEHLQAHHVDPVSEGGAPFDIGNGETVCYRCHLRHHLGVLPPAVAAWRQLLDAL